jgi:hypothetical protein
VEEALFTVGVDLCCASRIGPIEFLGFLEGWDGASAALIADINAYLYRLMCFAPGSTNQINSLPMPIVPTHPAAGSDD